MADLARISYSGASDMEHALSHLLRCHPHRFAVWGDVHTLSDLSAEAVECLKSVGHDAPASLSEAEAIEVVMAVPYPSLGQLPRADRAVAAGELVFALVFILSGLYLLGSGEWFGVTYVLLGVLWVAAAVNRVAQARRSVRQALQLLAVMDAAQLSFVRRVLEGARAVV